MTTRMTAAMIGRDSRTSMGQHRALHFLAISVATASLLLCETALAHDPGGDLLPVAEATHVAYRSGPWSSAATWRGTVPGNGARVHIPAGISVEQDGATADIQWIRVEGEFTVPRSAGSQTYVHTIWGSHTSRIDFGRSTSPVTATCIVEFIPGDFLTGDWQKLSRGLITTGELTVCGIDKTAWLAALPETAIPVGGTTVTLDSVPRNWRIGDTLIIAGTDSADQPGKPTCYQSERVTLDSVTGRVVTFRPAARFRHWSWRPDLRFHVANLSRNVEFRSRLAMPIEQRGHIMLMRHDGPYFPEDVRYCQFKDMGRTDKSRAVTDPRIDPLTGQPVPGSTDNPRARYAGAHNHRTGTLEPPATYFGVVTDGSPGWGFVNHASNIEFTDCIATRCFGSGFVTEEGQERGSFRHCLACLNRGQGDTITSTDDDHGQQNNGNWGTDGSGFWLQGGMVEVSECVSFDNSGRGFALFNTALNGWAADKKVPDYLWYPIVCDKSVLPEQYTSSVSSGSVPFIAKFDRNTAYMNKVGVQCWSSIFDPRPPDVVGRLTNTLIWGRGSQMHLEYLRPSHKIDGLTVVGDLLIRPEGWDSYSKYHGGCKVRFITQADVTNYSQVGTAGDFEAP